LISIQTADRVFDTGGSHPILITCNDNNSYVCKYHSSIGEAKRLFSEFVGAYFLKLWDLAIPDFALIKVKREHIPIDFNIRINHNITCFGSKYNSSYIDINQTNDKIAYPNKSDLIKIALFDIWLRNEDRNFNNYNLLVDVESNRNFVPIDHEQIFHTNNFNDFNPIEYHESLIGSDLVKNLIKFKDVSGEFRTNLKTYFVTKVQLCKENFVNIVEQLPQDWSINSKLLESAIFTKIFSDIWQNESFDLLLQFLQMNFNS